MSDPRSRALGPAGDLVSVVRPEGCICIEFSDTGGFRIADLTCPVHGVDGTEQGDAYWERTSGE